MTTEKEKVLDQKPPAFVLLSRRFLISFPIISSRLLSLLPVPQSWATRIMLVREPVFQMCFPSSSRLMSQAMSVRPDQRNYRVFQLARFPAPQPKPLPIALLPHCPELRRTRLLNPGPLVFPTLPCLPSRCQRA